MKKTLLPKKTLLLFAALFALGAAARAQVSVIPRGGIAFSTIAFKETGSFMPDREMVEPITGFTSGIGLEVPLAKNGFFSLQPELLYVQKGYQVVSNNGVGSFHGRVQFNYLEVPVLGKFTLGNEHFKCYINAGPSLAYGLGGSYHNVSSAGTFVSAASGRNIFGRRPETYVGDDVYYEPESYNRFDVGVQFGGGVGISVGPGALLLDARYGLGLSRFFKGDPVDPSSSTPTPDHAANIKNRVFALTLGYAIPLGGK